MAKHTTDSHHDNLGGVDVNERTHMFHRFVKIGFIVAGLTAIVLLFLGKFFT